MEASIAACAWSPLGAGSALVANPGVRRLLLRPARGRVSPSYRGRSRCGLKLVRSRRGVRSLWRWLCGGRLRLCLDRPLRRLRGLCRCLIRRLRLPHRRSAGPRWRWSRLFSLPLLAVFIRRRRVAAHHGSSVEGAAGAAAAPDCSPSLRSFRRFVTTRLLKSKEKIPQEGNPKAKC